MTSIKFFDDSSFTWSEKWSFCFKEDNEELLGPEVPYYSVIGALMYLANYTRPNITLFVNLQDIVLHQLIDIGIKSIMYLITWVYVILKDHNLNCLNMQTLPIFQTPTKLVSNEVCIYLWWYNNIMEINQANNGNMWTTLHQR